MVSSLVETAIWRRVARIPIVVRLRIANLTGICRLRQMKVFSPIDLFSINRE